MEKANFTTKINNKRKENKMDEKEKKLLETIKDYLSEGEEYRAKKFIFKNDKYI